MHYLAQTAFAAVVSGADLHIVAHPQIGTAPPPTPDVGDTLDVEVGLKPAGVMTVLRAGPGWKVVDYNGQTLRLTPRPTTGLPSAFVTLPPMHAEDWVVV